jgi:ubiquitin-conjugating enzyme E2 O
MDVATACPDIHQHDLVSFGPGLLDCGVVEAKGAAVEEDGTSPPVPTFHILCLDNSTVTKKASDLTVIDRSYLNIAQVVASASNVGGQIGSITGATTMLDLVRLDERGEVVETVSGVSPSRVRRVRALGHGDLVVSGPWLGQVSNVSVDVDVSFDDGAVCTVADAEGNEMLQTVAEYHYEKYLPQKNSRFFPGQRVGSAGSVFKNARWLHGHWNADRDVGTVVKVEMSSVLVHWIASTHCGTDQRLVEESAPPAYQNPRDLTFYCVAHNNFGWGPADRCFFTEPGSTHGDSSFAHDPQLEEEEQQHGTCLDKVELPMTVAKTRTYVDVLWQDGTQQHGVPSESVVPFNNINDQEFLPGYHVVDNASLDGPTVNDDTASDGSTKPARRVGVVRTICCKNQTVNVSWFKAAACPNRAREVECNDIVSAYDLELHPGDTTDLGDTVVRLLPSGSSDGETSIQSQSKSKTEKNVAPTNLSWVGCVIDLPDGHVQVKWGNGSISTVRVCAFTVVDIIKLS